MRSQVAVTTVRDTLDFDDGITKTKNVMNPCAELAMSDSVPVKPNNARPKQISGELRAAHEFRTHARRGDDLTAVTSVHNYSDWTEEELLARRSNELAPRGKAAQWAARMRHPKGGRVLSSLWSSNYRKSYGMNAEVTALNKRLMESEKLLKAAAKRKDVPYGAFSYWERDGLRSLYQADFVQHGKMPELARQQLDHGFPARRMLRLRPPRANRAARPQTPEVAPVPAPAPIPAIRAQTPNPQTILPFGEKRPPAETGDDMSAQEIAAVTAELRQLKSLYKGHQRKRKAGARRDSLKAPPPLPPPEPVPRTLQERSLAAHRLRQEQQLAAARQEVLGVPQPAAADAVAAAGSPRDEGQDSDDGWSSDGSDAAQEPVVPPYALDSCDPVLDGNTRKPPRQADALVGAQLASPPPLQEAARRDRGSDGSDDDGAFSFASFDCRRTGRRTFGHRSQGWNPINFRLRGGALPPCPGADTPTSGRLDAIPVGSAVAAVVAEEHKLLRDNAAYLRRKEGAEQTPVRQRQGAEAKPAAAMTPAPRPR